MRNRRYLRLELPAFRARMFIMTLQSKEAPAAPILGSRKGEEKTEAVSVLSRLPRIGAGRFLSVRPDPIADFGQVFAAGAGVGVMLNQFVPQPLFEIGGFVAKRRHAVNHIACQMEAV